MKNLISILILSILIQTNSHSQDLSPYIKVGESSQAIEIVSEEIKTVLSQNSFVVLGDYNPSNKATLKVIAFTRDDLKNTVINVKDRGALAGILKIGLEVINGKTTISYTNPEYLFRAYLGDAYKKHAGTLTTFSTELKASMAAIGTSFEPFGGAVKSEKLKKYHYKIMMPYFSDPINLKEFASYEEGKNNILKNLKNKVADTKLVYMLEYPSEQAVVFGVGLNNAEDGESHFLPKIGESHVAALPYEIILQGNTASILHGKYRLALHWPELTMGTFMKIMSTPGAIEDTFEALCQ